MRWRRRGRRGRRRGLRIGLLLLLGLELELGRLRGGLWRRGLRRGMLMVVLLPLPGPGIATSGAGVGGRPPAGHGVKVPPPFTEPQRPFMMPMT